MDIEAIVRLQSPKENSMSPDFTDEQLQEAVTALKREAPHIWQLMKDVMLSRWDDDRVYEENDSKIAQIGSGMAATFSKLQFVASSKNPSETNSLLQHRVIDVALSEVRHPPSGRV